MKKYFVFMLMFLFIGGISAQAQLKFGIKAGVNLSSVNLEQDNLLGNFDTENLAGFQVGPMIEFMSPLGLGIDLAVLYSQQGSNAFRNGINAEYKSNNLDVPLNLKYKFAILPTLLKIYGTAGPYISFKLSDNLEGITATIEDKAFGAGLNFGFGVELLKHLQIGANYQMGLTENYSTFDFGIDDIFNLKGKPATWSVTATYLF